jgi:GrpB-like predicted nucleotidyltransferase (UPF0157 family)
MTTTRTGVPITIAAYDPAWPATFLRERDAIIAACGAAPFVRIEHIGSTSVPGLAAKPIIDMMPGLRTLDDAPPLIDPLAALGWAYVPEFERPVPELNDPSMPSRRYFRKDVAGQRAFHMHMVEVTSDFWRDQLLFRDYLRAFPAEADAYAELKRRLAADFNERLTPSSNVNVGYTDRKSGFITERLARARGLVARGELTSGP